ncbi:MAG: hypothetical protein K9I36_14325, partial [Bacteroidia bacterium]|nr:hypothetical protein [Bacteroidia bacterium]
GIGLGGCLVFCLIVYAFNRLRFRSRGLSNRSSASCFDAKEAFDWEGDWFIRSSATRLLVIAK